MATVDTRSRAAVSEGVTPAAVGAPWKSEPVPAGVGVAVNPGELPGSQLRQQFRQLDGDAEPPTR
jgi:hypothetical protein